MPKQLKSTKDMSLICSEDDCAPDAREYFEANLAKVGIPSLKDFQTTGEKLDDGMTTQHVLCPYVLEISADDP